MHFIFLGDGKVPQTSQGPGYLPPYLTLSTGLPEVKPLISQVIESDNNQIIKPH